MFGKRKKDVLVVGAGPVGLFTALSLARRGRSVELIDEEWRTGAHSYALALHPASLDLLEEAGLAAALVARGRRVDGMAFYDGTERRAEVSFRDLDVKHPFLLVLPQSALEGALEEAAKAAGVDLRWNHALAAMESRPDRVVASVDRLAKVSGGYATATTEWSVERTAEVTASHLVGADGHRSTVRRLLGLSFEPAGEAATFAVFEFACGPAAPPEVRVVLDARSTSVFWPLPEGRGRWSFQIDAPEEPPERSKSRLAVQIGRQAFPHLGREKLMELLGERAPWFDAEVGDLRWSLAVRFQSHLAWGFGRGRAWLAGDSGHVAGPVGIQSMNVGLREGADLAGRIAAIQSGKGPPELLETYGEERAAEWRLLLGHEGAPKARDGADPWIAENAARILPCLPASGPHLEQLLEALRLSQP